MRVETTSECLGRRIGEAVRAGHPNASMCDYQRVADNLGIEFALRLGIDPDAPSCANEACPKAVSRCGRYCPKCAAARRRKR